jgi:hypothetical protein
MPCPVFFPTRVAEQPAHQFGRLPLIDQYMGTCMARPDGYEPDSETLFRSCNHGYSQESCPRYPLQQVACLRYTITARSSEVLEGICIEEDAHTPQRWHRFVYLLQMGDLQGDVPTECMRAQAIAFCEAYVRHLPRSESN